ncbi:MAG: hypothetical protein R3A13_04910 [Bdellovibrionota bacterium]
MQEYSVGDFVLMGGDIPAMAVTETCNQTNSRNTRQSNSTENESFSASNNSLLEAPHYADPPEFNGKKPPEVLLSK